MKTINSQSIKKALLESIEHWHQNLDMLILNHLSDSLLTYDIHIGPTSCALCILFNRDCDDCPINIANRNTGCSTGTYPIVSKMILNDDEKSYNKLYKAISNELEFLYSLLKHHD